MAICNNCGATVPDDTRFCPVCGAAVGEVPAPAPEEQQPQYQPADFQQAPPQQPYQQPDFQQAPPQYQQFPPQQQYQQPYQGQYQQQYQQQPYQQQRFVPPGYEAEDIEQNRVLSMFCYIASILGVLLVLIAQPDSKYCRFHANQALVLMVFYLCCAIVTIVPFLGWIVGGIGAIFGVVCEIIGIVRALKGKVEPLPLIGKYTILH